MLKKRCLSKAAQRHKKELIKAAWQTKPTTPAPVYKLHKITFDDKYQVALRPVPTTPRLSRSKTRPAPTMSKTQRPLVMPPPPLLSPIYEPYRCLIPVSPPLLPYVHGRTQSLQPGWMIRTHERWCATYSKRQIFKQQPFSGLP